MISTSHAQYKALTAPQRAKVRKAIAEYEAERQPIMYAVGKLEESLRRQAVIDLDIVKKVEDIEQEFIPGIETLTLEINKLCDERRRLEDAKNKAMDELGAEPYRIAGSNPKVVLLREMWGDANTRHEAKIAELFESFKTEGVA